MTSLDRPMKKKRAPKKSIKAHFLRCRSTITRHLCARFLCATLLMSTRNRARSYCFTVNNPNEDEVLVSQSWDPTSYNYLVYQLEEGAEGTRHLQGYINLKNPRDFDSFCDWFPGRRVHLEIAKGNAKQNRNYCTKSEGRIEGPWEFGVLPEQGKRNDLLAVKADLDEGASMSEIAQNHLF